MSSQKIYRFTNEIKVAQQRLKVAFNKKKSEQQKNRHLIAQLLKENRVNHAKIKTEYIIRDDYLIEALEIIELYLELILVRATLILKKDFDPYCLDAMAGLCYCASRVPDIPELNKLSKILHPLVPKSHAVDEKLKSLVDFTRARPQNSCSSASGNAVLSGNSGCF